MSVVWFLSSQRHAAPPLARADTRSLGSTTSSNTFWPARPSGHPSAGRRCALEAQPGLVRDGDLRGGCERGDGERRTAFTVRCCHAERILFISRVKLMSRGEINKTLAELDALSAQMTDSVPHQVIEWVSFSRVGRGVEGRADNKEHRPKSESTWVYQDDPLASYRRKSVCPWTGFGSRGAFDRACSAGQWESWREKGGGRAEWAELSTAVALCIVHWIPRCSTPRTAASSHTARSGSRCRPVVAGTA